MSTSLRYVVLRHEGVDEPHFDLMFETAPRSDLATWRSHEWPLRMLSPIVSIQDHRREYLDYAGPLTGDRGSVDRIAAGTHRLKSDDPVLLVTELDTGVVLRLFRGDGPNFAQVLG